VINMSYPIPATPNLTPSRTRSSLIGHPATGALLIIVPVMFTVAFTLLGSSFEYPSILRKPVSYVLQEFQAGGSGLIAQWYVMLAASLAFTAIPLMVRRLFPERSLGLDLSVLFGTMAGLVQALGFARWVFLVPALAAANADSSASDATRAAVSVIFDAFNRYAGAGLGEHLGYLFTGLWTLLVAVPLARRSKVMGISGIVFATGILVGLLDPAGIAVAGAVNAISYLAWSAWVIALGVTALRAPIGEARA
jgi:Domain of unknown function (DUF4386)